VILLPFALSAGGLGGIFGEVYARGRPILFPVDSEVSPE